MVSYVYAAPFVGIFFWKVWYCLHVPCFYNPNGIDVDSSGNVFVTDSLNYRIEETSNSGGFIRTWGNDAIRPSIRTGEFNWAYDVAVDKSGNVFVTDASNFRIQEFTNTGKFIRAWGSLGTANGQFYYPTGIAVDFSGNVFVLDTVNHRIQKFQLASTCPKGTESTSGVCFIKKWGSHGTGNGQFSFPAGVDVDSSGNVFVADSGNHRIQKFNNDGTFIKMWGTFGTGKSQFNYPFDLGVDKSGHVFVADTNNDRIQKFDNDGSYIRAWGNEGSGSGQFNDPRGVAVDSSDDVYVADFGNDRIQKFKTDGTFLKTWGSTGPWD